ncbi:hypothetical protein [Hymenobacter rubripertinctus]|uniref:Uncharacterized protein n=1 Tax=Hymenobacter rubripertinctus TaxID=2029981 RepID=A0A418QTF0_9BACT|nr:hypothetical protein [Hymenobacter rubripertinctus]RIY08424.1 hypothetical protein D0T11_14380 [Hymenobacter rubripertinctus]
MFTRLLQLSLVFFVLSFGLPAPVAAQATGRILPSVRAKIKGQNRMHRPNYHVYRAYRYY